jgi:hypothetical protein
MSDPTDPTPERPGMAHPGTPRDSEAEETDGQVSEASSAGVVSDGDSVVGSPSTEGGEVDRGAIGPAGVPPENERDNDFKKPGHGKLSERIHDL